MICSANTVQTLDWIGNQLLRSDGCYETSDHTSYEEASERSGCLVQALQAMRRSIGHSPRKRSRPSVRLSRRLTLANAAREYIWLWDLRHGLSLEAIASREGLTIRRVRFGVARAQAHEQGCCSESSIRPPRLVPLFPLGPYTPHSSCRHKRPIQSGSLLCCMICHESGMDRHPALRRDPRTDPAPEPKLASKPCSLARETRRQRRQRQFAT
jgi:hypothetical protein